MELMLKVPDLRHFLESYDLGASALERFRAASPADETLILGYVGLCHESGEVTVSYCDGQCGRQLRC